MNQQQRDQRIEDEQEYNRSSRFMPIQTFVNDRDQHQNNAPSVTTATSGHGQQNGLIPPSSFYFPQREDIPFNQISYQSSAFNNQPLRQEMLIPMLQEKIQRLHFQAQNITPQAVPELQRNLQIFQQFLIQNQEALRQIKVPKIFSQTKQVIEDLSIQEMKQPNIEFENVINQKISSFNQCRSQIQKDVTDLEKKLLEEEQAYKYKVSVEQERIEQLKREKEKLFQEKVNQRQPLAKENSGNSIQPQKPNILSSGVSKLGKNQLGNKGGSIFQKKS